MLFISPSGASLVFPGHFRVVTISVRSHDMFVFFFFFFSSRRRHTRFDCDWSSDVCSSDLERMTLLAREMGLAILSEEGTPGLMRRIADPVWFQAFGCVLGFDWHSSGLTRSEERRVGKECRSRWSPYH